MLGLLGPAMVLSGAGLVAPGWTKALSNASWPPRDSAGFWAFKGRLWVGGGWINSFSDPPRDVWSIEPGQQTEWQQAVAVAPWTHTDFATTNLVHNGRMYHMGGWRE